MGQLPFPLRGLLLGQGSHHCYQFHAIGFYFCDVTADTVAFCSFFCKDMNLVLALTNFVRNFNFVADCCGT